MSPDKVLEERRAVVEEARSWIQTPYHHRASIKGAGVDCAMLLVAVFTGLGLVEPFEVPYYPRDWHLHRSEELFLNIVSRYADEHAGPALPGDIALWRIGRTLSHGGIVIDWPTVIHAWSRSEMVRLADASKTPYLLPPREVHLYRLRRWA